jgi:hypothetical protein
MFANVLKIKKNLNITFTMLYHRDGAWFPADVTLSIQAKDFNFVSIRPENVVSHGQSLGAFWQTPSRLS